MKIGVGLNRFESAQAYSRFGDDCYKKMKSFGFSCVDYNFGNENHIIYTADEATVDAYLLHEKKLAHEAGIEISQTHGPWRWPPRDEQASVRADWLQKMKQAVRATAMLDCKYCVVHPIMPFGIEEINTPEAKLTWELNLQFMRELVKTAELYNVTVCLENMPMTDFSMGTPDSILRFVKEINNEHFKICLDTGHVSVYGSDLNLADEVRKLGDYIKVLHIHDNKYGYDAHLFPGLGWIDWKSFMQALRDIDYKGVFSLETAPSAEWSDEIFSETSISLVKIAKDIINQI